MKYSEMEKFLNDNGILIIQPVIANEVDCQLPHEISDEEFEEICKSVEDAYVSSFEECDIWELVNQELIMRGYAE